ncbi:MULTISPECIES: hypothetical protein [unclassified Moraxella]|uniref:hypothetical protein n=1 Tax=unclassified Moraxella TaxID=2685852 RepID=UPI003AF7186B
MFCYQCKTESLKPTKLDLGLPALRCEKCHGTHLDLLTYRAWSEDNASSIEADKQSDEPVVIDELTNTENALICQHCHKFMLKYRINNEHNNTINVCHTCYDVWLDQGEWELLKQLKIQDKLTEIMSEPWQKDLREQAKEQAVSEHYHQLLGDDFERVSEFGKWLDSHPKRAEIRSLLFA